MTLFPLDCVRNAPIDQKLEPAIEELRDEIAVFKWPQALGSTHDVLRAFDLARPRLNVLVSLILQRRQTRGVDVGTGLGFLPVLLGKFGIDVAASERDVDLAEFAVTHGIEVVPHEIGRQDSVFGSETFGFIVFAEVLEHLRFAPGFVMTHLTAMLQSDGILFLTTPNIARLSHVEALIAGENFLERFPEEAGASDALDHIEHVREYSVREVVEALENAQLSVERVLMTGWGEAGYRPLSSPYSNEIIVAVAQK